MFTLQTSFWLLLLKGGRGVNLLVEVIVNSKEENSQDFCPNYVQEIDLWIDIWRQRERFILNLEYFLHGCVEGRTYFEVIPTLNSWKFKE